MKLLEYSNNKYVIDFVNWIEPKLSNENSFNHSYLSKKPKKKYVFNSIYSAFNSYSWRESFDEKQNILSKYSEKINSGLNKNQYELVLQACMDILEWGGVKNNGNVNRINQLDKEIIKYLLYVKNIIVLNSCDLDEFSCTNIHCNSGFSKIYSTIIDGFIIYDSRVSCALCYFVRSWAEEKGLREIPDNLKLAFSIGRGNNKDRDRNPSKGNYSFFKLNNNNYLKNNIIASWLLKLIIDNTKSKFNELSPNMQIRALESAMFMIGYKIPGGK